jgi:hypothetical protein
LGSAGAIDNGIRWVAHPFYPYFPKRLPFLLERERESVPAESKLEAEGKTKEQKKQEDAPF